MLPAAVPIAKEAATFAKNPPIMLNTIATLLLSSVKASPTAEVSYRMLPTTLNRMMATASFMSPSPNTIENSFGY